MPLRDAHRAGLAIVAVSEAKRPDAPADVTQPPRGRDAMAAFFEFVRGYEAGETCTDDYHMKLGSPFGHRRERGQRGGRRRSRRKARTGVAEFAAGEQATA